MRAIETAALVLTLILGVWAGRTLANSLERKQW